MFFREWMRGDRWGSGIKGVNMVNLGVFEIPALFPNALLVKLTSKHKIVHSILFFELMLSFMSSLKLK